MDEAARVQLDADPEWSESYLGPEPDFTPADLRVWSFYWTVRNSTPPDLPVDLERALSLHARLYGETNEIRLASKIQAMDGAFMAGRSEIVKSRKENRKTGGGR